MPTARMLEHDWFPRPLPDSVAAGERAWIYSSFAFVHCHAQRPGAVRIGRDTGIYHGTFFELGPDADVHVGDFCALVGAIICTNGHVRIGHYTFIAHEVVLADGPWAVPEASFPRLAALQGSAPLAEGSVAPLGPPPPDDGAASERRVTGRGIELGENCWVGMGAVLLSGTKLADNCVVGAGAVVNFAAPPYSIIAGNPARIVGTAR